MGGEPRQECDIDARGARAGLALRDHPRALGDMAGEGAARDLMSLIVKRMIVIAPRGSP